MLINGTTWRKQPLLRPPARMAHTRSLHSVVQWRMYAVEVAGYAAALETLQHEA